MKGNCEYYLGLDMGTSSVGWAVTDPQYNLIRRKGKDLWGIREFEEAQVAAERRAFRTSRRRRQREVVRMGILKSLFADEIAKVDPYFFIRLDNSKYYLEDKDDSVRYKYGLFNDTDYTDVEYYKEYPTIFHLRKELILNKEPHDIRLVYLAISNMFKHRGHFLNESLSSGGARSAQLIYDAYVEETTNIVINENEDTLSFAHIDANAMEAILSDRNISRKIKSERIIELLRVDKKNKTAIEHIKCMCGLKTDTKKLFPTFENEEKVDICFSDFGYEDKISDIMNAIGDENYRILELMKEIYDSGILSSILKGGEYLSISRVKDYEKHAEDLKLLKRTVRRLKSRDDYDYLFHSEADGSYSAYVNSYNFKNIKKRRGCGARKAEDLYSCINKMFKDIKNDKDVDYILNEINNENFLPKQLNSTNGVIPNQIHKAELSKILENAENYLPFLTKKDDSDLSVSQKVISLFEFHVPYYVGPVTENSAKSGGNGWVVRKEAGKVYPWNFDEKINLGETAEEFIRRMVRTCTYIRDERVLPKGSLMYESYIVLNALNNIKINEERINNTLKQDIYNDLFLSGKRVTQTRLNKYLFTRGIIENENQVTGFDKDINLSLTSYGKFASVFGEDMKKDSVKKMVERIIFLGTVYGDSKKLFKESVAREYGEILSDVQLKRIFGFKFSDWGKLSRELLELSGVNIETGEVMSLYRALWETNLNFMELISKDEYGFKASLNEKTVSVIKSINEFEYEDLADFYFSAPVKRMVWQTILLIKEIKDIMGNEPEKIFIEMTREDGKKGDKGRTSSRKNKFLDLYKSIKDESKNWAQIIEDSDRSGRLRSKKMYLYLTQMGKDMYTGKDIDLDELFNDNIYNIDHIYPQSVTKDDNLENNLVLVHGDVNREKSNEYPLNERILGNTIVRNHWKYLHECGLINNEKYARLTSRKPLSEEELAGFIARQIVETSQATKGIADILKGICPSSELVYSRAKNVSRFRADINCTKSRILNDFHHAQDAYLNIVVGNAYNVKFTNNPVNFIKKEFAKDPKKYSYNLSKLFERDIVRGEKIGWIAPKEGNRGSLAIVEETMKRSSPLMTRMSFEAHGAISDATLYSTKGKDTTPYIPLKSTDRRLADVSKYGGFKSVKIAYFCLVESERKGKKIRTIEAVPIILIDRIKNDQCVLIDYFINQYELINPKILLAKIKVQSLFRINGYYVHLSGKTVDRLAVRNAVNLILPAELRLYVHDVEKSLETNEFKTTISTEMNMKLYEELCRKHSVGIFAKKPNAMGRILETGRTKFSSLDLREQTEVLYQILNLTKIGVTGADLSKIGGAGKSGVMSISKNISECEEFLMIGQSVTGVYEHSIDLLNI